MEQTIEAEHVAVPDPKLQQTRVEPKGVIRKNLKVWIFLGASAVVLCAALVSNWTKKGSGHSSASPQSAPQPALQDNTDNNVQDLKNQLAAERQREAQATAQATLANNVPPVIEPGVVAGASQVGLCTPGQPCQQQEVYAQPQVSPEEQQAQQLAARERELAYNARFASNLVYTRSSDAQAAFRQGSNSDLGTEAQTAVGQPSEQAASSLISSRNAAERRVLQKIPQSSAAPRSTSTRLQVSRM
jgi:type IV secretion system protein TrbI